MAGSEAERVIHLAGYVPDFLRNVKEFEQLFQTEERELRGLYETMDRLWRDSFLQWAGPAGIKRYESLLGIGPYPGDGLDERRAAALLKWNQQLPYTLPRLIERLDAAVGRESYELYIRGRRYELELVVTDRSYRVLRSVRDMTRDMIPANLLFLFAGRYSVEIPVPMAASSRLELESEFYARYNREFLYLDGSWALDGTYRLNGYKEKEGLELYPARLTVRGGYETVIFCATPQVKSVAEARAAPDAQTRVWSRVEVKESGESRNCLMLQAEAQAGPETELRLRVENNLWYLDGTHSLDGTRQLDAEIFEYSL